MIPNNNEVPPTSAPTTSANDANNPMARPPIIVKGITYLESIDSKILLSFLNPGICNPDFKILSACAEASIPDVFTQNTEKSAAKNMKKIICPIICPNNGSSQLPCISLSTMFVELTQYKNPQPFALHCACPFTIFPKNVGWPSQFCNNPPNNCRLATSAAVKITGITLA